MSTHLVTYHRLGNQRWRTVDPQIAGANLVGLAIPKFEAHFTPCVEIAWRLAAEHWGNGYAPEGARAALEFGFTRFDEIVSFTVPANLASRRVMEKIGMEHDPSEDFEHSSLPEGDPLQRHVLYRLRRKDWAKNATSRS